MQRIVLIARREFGAMVATKAFLFTLIAMPILMLGGIVLLPMLGKLGGAKTRKIAVADAGDDSNWFETIRSAAQARNDAIRATVEAGGDESSDDPVSGVEYYEIEPAPAGELSDDQRLQLSDRIREGELYAIVEIPKDLGNSPDAEIKFASQDATLSSARRWLQSLVGEEVQRRRLTDIGIDPEVVRKASRPVRVSANAPYEATADGGAESASGADTLTALFVPFGVMMLMFVVIFMAAQPMLESGMEEKQHRIAELLLGHVSASELMTGKLLGNVAGSFVVFAIYAAGAITVVVFNDYDVSINVANLPWLIVFQVLGVLLFSSIFLTIGASVSELKEAQSLLLPVWMLLLAPLMVWLAAVREPNGWIATTLSFFPPSAPMMMALRLSSSQAIPWWHAPVAAALLLVATLLIVRLAARIYRASLLKSDSAASFVKMWQRARTAA